MQDLSDREIDLMDKIVVLTISYSKQGLWRQGTQAQILNISEEEYQFFVDKIAELNEPKIVNILDKGTDYQSIDNCYETQRFIDRGGFRQVFNEQINADTAQIKNSSICVNFWNGISKNPLISTVIGGLIVAAIIWAFQQFN